VDDLLTARRLDAVNYITDATQATDFYWDRGDSGLRIRVGVHVGPGGGGKPDQAFETETTPTDILASGPMESEIVASSWKVGTTFMALGVETKPKRLFSRPRRRPNPPRDRF